MNLSLKKIKIDARLLKSPKAIVLRIKFSKLIDSQNKLDLY